MNDQDETFRGRRRFLRQTVTAAGGGVLLLLTAQEEGSAGHFGSGETGAGAAPVSQGYRVTDHVRSYYATLRS